MHHAKKRAQGSSEEGVYIVSPGQITDQICEPPTAAEPPSCGLLPAYTSPWRWSIPIAGKTGSIGSGQPKVSSAEMKRRRETLGVLLPNRKKTENSPAGSDYYPPYP